MMLLPSGHNLVPLMAIVFITNLLGFLVYSLLGDWLGHFCNGCIKDDLWDWLHEHVGFSGDESQC